jgi:hypothetical protein
MLLQKVTQQCRVHLWSHPPEQHCVRVHCRHCWTHSVVSPFNNSKSARLPEQHGRPMHTSTCWLLLFYSCCRNSRTYPLYTSPYEPRPMHSRASYRSGSSSAKSGDGFRPSTAGAEGAPTADIAMAMPAVADDACAGLAVLHCCVCAD